MPDLPSKTELFRRWRAGALGVPNTRVSPREIDREGSDLNLVAASDTTMGEEMVNRNARALASCFEDSSEGQQLDRVIFDRKGLLRKGAAPAVGQITLTRPTAGAGAGTVDGGLPGSGPPDPTRIITNSGITYLLVEPAVFGVADLGPITVPVQAQLAGLDFEVGADQAWSFVDVPFDTSIVIANADEMAGAADEEVDPAFRMRSRNFFPTIRRGTIGAVLFGLQSAAGIENASVIEIINPESGFPAAVLSGFVLDALGNANETLSARASLALLEFRAGGIPVIVFPGVPQYIDIEILLTFDSQIVIDTVLAANKVKIAIIAAMNNLNPGDTLQRSLILAAARSVKGVRIADTALVAPAGDLVPPSPDIAFRTLTQLISTT